MGRIVDALYFLFTIRGPKGKRAIDPTFRRPTKTGPYDGPR